MVARTTLLRSYAHQCSGSKVDPWPSPTNDRQVNNPCSFCVLVGAGEQEPGDHYQAMDLSDG